MKYSCEHHCPICNNILLEDDNIGKIKELSCRLNSENHFFSKRIENNQNTISKYRISENGVSYHVRINFETKSTLIWKRPGFSNIEINEIVKLNFDDIERAKNRIKTYLLLR